MGCTDTAPPTHATPYELSRIKDVIDALKAAGIDVDPFWKTIPYNVRVEFNYSRWDYEAAQPGKKADIYR